MTNPAGIELCREARIIFDRALAETGPEHWTAPTVRVAAILAGEIHRVSVAARASQFADRRDQ